MGKDKIVVIDDPVSSMDSSVLFIVSTLVREMVEVCYNIVAPELKCRLLSKVKMSQMTLRTRLKCRFF
ncbi:MAG: AAA family ATPase [Deltaproteobacteria bacterium]|nr:AAA family ATPase [Deltaproteobacteria bacterium]